MTIASPRDPLAERLQRAPDVAASPGDQDPGEGPAKPKRTVRVQAFDDAGTLVHAVEVTTDDCHMVTGVREHDGRVWMGSLEEPAVAVHRL